MSIYLPSRDAQRVRDQLTFRVKLTIAPELLVQYADRARAGGGAGHRLYAGG
ncbi:MAG: hypothetical protein WAT09_04020 [Paracoccaceae bacterium]